MSLFESKLLQENKNDIKASQTQSLRWQQKSAWALSNLTHSVQYKDNLNLLGRNWRQYQPWVLRSPCFSQQITKLCLVARQIKNWQPKRYPLKVEVVRGRRPGWSACWHSGGQGSWEGRSYSWQYETEAAASLSSIKSHRGIYLTLKREILLIGCKMLCSGLNNAEAVQAWEGLSSFNMNEWTKTNSWICQEDLKGWSKTFHKPKGGLRGLHEVSCWKSKI